MLEISGSSDVIVYYLTLGLIAVFIVVILMIISYSIISILEWVL